MEKHRFPHDVFFHFFFFLLPLPNFYFLFALFSMHFLELICVAFAFDNHHSFASPIHSAHDGIQILFWHCIAFEVSKVSHLVPSLHTHHHPPTSGLPHSCWDGHPISSHTAASMQLWFYGGDVGRIWAGGVRRFLRYQAVAAVSAAGTRIPRLLSWSALAT